MMIREFIKNQPLLKLLSLLMAFFLWFYVRGERKLETNLDVAVEVANLPEKLVISREFDSVLQVRVNGPASRVEKLKRDHDTLYRLDLSSAKRGVNTYWIKEESLNLPSGVKIVQIVPQVLRVYLDRSEERQVAAVARFTGALEYGFEMLGYEVNPSLVKVKGTRSDLSGVEKIQTLPIQLSGRRKSFTEEVPLEASERFMSLDGSKVTVTVTIRENRVAKKISNIPVLIHPPSEEWDVQPAEVSAVVEGMAGKVLGVVEPLDATIDGSKLKSIGKNTVVVQPKVKPQEGVEINLFPERVTVVRRKKGGR